MPESTNHRVKEEVLRWLHQVLQPNYRSVQRTFDDVTDVLYEHPSLMPKTDVYTYEDGRTCLLLLLYGTLLVKFRQRDYNIPINIWLPQEYPKLSPIIFVVPSTGMAVRPGNHVDDEGRCYHPYLAYWTEDVRKSSLATAIRTLQTAFEREPPLYALSASSTSTEASDTGRSGVHLAEQRHDSRFPQSSIKPPVPAKIQASRSNNADRGTVRSRSNASAPALRAKPSGLLQEHGQDSATIRLLPRDPRFQILSTTPRTPTVGKEDFLSDDLHRTSPSPALPQKPIHHGFRQLQLDVLALLHQRVRASYKATSSQTTSMDSVTNKLKILETTLCGQIEQLDRIKNSSENNALALRERINRARETTHEAEAFGAPTIDECVVAQNVVYNQLYDLVANDMSLQDTIYILGKALENERIDLDTFLKYVKLMAREQFMQRALTLKICGHANLQC